MTIATVPIGIKDEGKRSADASLRLQFDAIDFWPVAQEGAIFTFVVPPNLSEACIVSRTGVLPDPQEGLSSPLGVAVARIILRSSAYCREIAVDHPLLSFGFYPAERLDNRIWRWTDGRALLPGSLLFVAGARPQRIEIQLHSRLPLYRI